MPDRLGEVCSGRSWASLAGTVFSDLADDVRAQRSFSFFPAAALRASKDTTEMHMQSID